MTDANRGGPLAGVKVLDFGHYVAGPGAAMMLGDQGAEVTRIERPNMPELRDVASAVLNRGKRRLVLNLKDKIDQESARRLIASADVVIENFRPNVMSRLGLGYETVRDLNPQLVYLSLPGFSRDDAAYADVAAWEGVVAAAMGQFTDMGLNRTLMGVEASYSPLTLASAYAAIFGVMSVVLALRSRLKSKVGEWIEVPLAAALMEGLAYNSLHVDDLPERYKSLREREIERRRASGLPMNLTYHQLQPLLDPFYRTYRCRDGRQFYVVSGSHSSHAQRALKVLGLWDDVLVAGIPLADPYARMQDWPNGEDCTLKAYPITEPWANELTQRMSAAFLTRDSTEWERLFGEAGAPAAAHRTSKEWINSAHAKQAGLMVEVDDPVHGTMLQPGPVAWLTQCPPPEDLSAVKEFTQSEAGSFTEGAIRDSVDANAWLEGLTILDMTNVIAGPTVAGALSRFGARVIKLDPVVPTYDPWNTIVFGMYSNRSKESVLVDVKTPCGREILRRLIEKVDVITINATAKQLGPLGLDFEELQKINPRLVLCHLDAYGGQRTGPRSEYPGYDDLVQASTGIMERFGGSMSTVEEHAHFGTIDVLGGLAAAFAVSLALYRREITGRGDTARTSLASAGQWLQSRFMYDFKSRPPFDEPRGPDAKGEQPLYRCYRVSDKWVFVAGAPGAWDKLAGSRLLGPVTQAPFSQREALLEKIFRSDKAEFWQHHLRPFDVTVQPLESLAHVRRTGLTADRSKTIEFTRDERHPSGYAVEHTAPKAVRLLQTPLRRGFAAPKYGASTRSILSELGYSATEIDVMIENRAVSESWSSSYLPD